MGDVDRRLLPLHRTVFGVVVVALVLGEVHKHLQGDAERLGQCTLYKCDTLELVRVGLLWSQFDCFGLTNWQEFD